MTKPWAGWVETGDEHRYTEVIRIAARRLQDGLEHKGVRSALIGGTGLRLADGLPRLSNDLDLKVTRATAGSDRLVMDAVNDLDGWNAREATAGDEARGLEGIVITDERTGMERSTEIDLIPGQLADWDTAGVAEPWLVERGGVLTYPTHLLAELKMGTLIGARTREMAHDVFDVAWLMHEYGYLVGEEHRRALGTWVEAVSADSTKWREWNNRFRRHEDGAWKWDDTVRTMDEALRQADRIVAEGRRLADALRGVQRRTGEATIGGEIDATGTITGLITDGEGRRIRYGRISRSEVIAVAMNETGHLAKSDIPELVLTLEKDRAAEQAIAAARSMT